MHDLYVKPMSEEALVSTKRTTVQTVHWRLIYNVMRSINLRFTHLLTYLQWLSRRADDCKCSLLTRCRSFGDA